MTQSLPADHVWLTPPQLAKRLGIGAETVLIWIRNGELRAANLATRLGGRPRWRISPEALEEFLRRREATPRAMRIGHFVSGSDGRGKVISDDDGRLAKNIPHEVRVKRMASLMANRNTGNGAEWRPYVQRAIARYAQKTGVEVDEEVVLALKNPWDD